MHLQCASCCCRLLTERASASKTFMTSMLVDSWVWETGVESLIKVYLNACPFEFIVTSGKIAIYEL